MHSHERVKNYRQVGDLDSAGGARMSLHRLLTRLTWMCAGPLILPAVYLAFSSVLSKQAERGGRP
jgi:hypothetical protein